MELKDGNEQDRLLLINHSAFVIAGQWVIEKARPDIMKKFSSFLSDDMNVIPQYIFQCNAQNPT
jgi:hypothetical protein